MFDCEDKEASQSLMLWYLLDDTFTDLAFKLFLGFQHFAPQTCFRRQQKLTYCPEITTNVKF